MTRLRKDHLLKQLDAKGPQTFTEFTHGTSINESVAPSIIARYLTEMAHDGLVDLTHKHYSITQEGRARIKALPLTPGVLFGSMSTKGTYRTPTWHTRPGSDAFLKIPSLGFSGDGA